MDKLQMKKEDIDLVVVGAGMSGLMAAMAAKSEDLRVVIIEPSNVLGGQGTAGGVAGFCGDSNRTNRLFQELIGRLAEHDFINPYNPNADRREFELEWCAYYLDPIRKAFRACGLRFSATGGPAYGWQVSGFRLPALPMSRY